MAITVEALAQEAATELGEQFSNINTREQYIAWLHEARTEIAASGWFFNQNSKESITLIASQREYPMPVTVSEIVSLEDTFNNRKIAYAPVGQLLERNKNLSSEGTPTHFYIDSFDSSLRMVISLYPVPDAAYVASATTLTAHCQLRVPSLTDTDNVPLQEDYIKVLRDGIRYRSRIASGQLELASAAKQDFSSGLQLLNARYNGSVRPGGTLPSHTIAHQVAQHPSAGGK